MPLSGLILRTRAVFRKVTRPIVRKGWMHWLRFAALLALGSYAGHELSDSRRFTDWRYWLYQKQVRWERRGPVYPRYTALVLLDDDDFWSEEYQGRSKLKRDRLAALLDRLNQAGVNTVALDVLFDSPLPDQPDYEFPDYRNEDQALFDALARMCAADRHVVLATEYWYADESSGTDAPAWTELPAVYRSRLSALPCVSRGHVDLPDDLRQIPGRVPMHDGSYLDSMSLAVTRIADPIAYDGLVHNQDNGFRFAQFLTPDDFAARNGRQFIFSGRQLAQMTLPQLRQSLADKTVIVGVGYHTFAHGVGYVADTFDSPGGVEPGSMLHANYVEAMRDPSSTFAPISDRTAEWIEWGLAMLLALIGALEVHSGWKWLGFSVSFLASVVLTYVLLQNLGVFLDFFIPILIILAHTVVESLLEMRHELHHARSLLHAHAVPHSPGHVDRQRGPKPPIPSKKETKP